MNHRMYKNSQVITIAHYNKTAYSSGKETIGKFWEYLPESFSGEISTENISFIEM